MSRRVCRRRAWRPCQVDKANIKRIATMRPLKSRHATKFSSGAPVIGKFESYHDNARELDVSPMPRCQRGGHWTHKQDAVR